MKNLFSCATLLFLMSISCTDESKNTDTAEETTQASKDSIKNEEAENKNGYEIIVPDLSIAWGFVFLQDESMLIGEQNGDLILFKDGKKSDVTGMPEVYHRGQGGLLDIKLHPNYKDNGYIYITYASPTGSGDGGNTAIMRTKLNGTALTDQKVLYKAEPNTTAGQHFGSRIAFDDEGYLYFSAGERGNRDDNPQDITRDNGKIYRLKDDGTIPNDNPFYNQSGAKKAIYSYGHRNPQGMDIHPTTRKIWTHEHGPRGGDEINIIKKGANYGWPVISYGINYDGTPFTDITAKEGMEQPIHYWDPSIAPSGMAFITSDKYPGWKGNLLIGSLKFQYVANCFINGDKVTKEEKLLEGIGRVRTINQGPDGYIYVSVENVGIVKLLPK
ncbi:quinoprotein glucose dehydrogenase [Flavobacteriaceae bacterium MAR_2010_188]|nr:quinoprotein glucose dehydrogenase [Flavobacteriaceae bacterium MAR_2010_188]